jgi:hypothetical protein
LQIFLDRKLFGKYEHEYQYIYNQGATVVPRLPRKEEVKLKHQLGLELAPTIKEKLFLRLSLSIRQQVDGSFGTLLWKNIENPIRERIKIDPIYRRLQNCINCREWIVYACRFDHCIKELKVPHDPQLWSIFKNLVTSCDWLVPFSKG